MDGWWRMSLSLGRERGRERTWENRYWVRCRKRKRWGLRDGEEERGAKGRKKVGSETEVEVERGTQREHCVCESVGLGLRRLSEMAVGWSREEEVEQ